MSKQNVLWFASGVGLSTCLCIGYGAARFVPAAITFGVLCFVCGIMLMQFANLRKQEELSANGLAKSLEDWLDELKELNEERKACGEERLKLEEEWNTLDNVRKAWELEKENSIRNEALRWLEREAARLGGEQIDRDLNSN